MQRLDTSFVNHRQQLRQGLKASASPMIPLINPILKQETNRLLTKLSDLLQLNPRKSKIASHCHSYLTRYRNDTERRYTVGKRPDAAATIRNGISRDSFFRRFWMRDPQILTSASLCVDEIYFSILNTPLNA
jgi:hypothetical protein